MAEGGTYRVFSFFFPSPDFPPPARSAQLVWQHTVGTVLTIWTPTKQTTLRKHATSVSSAPPEVFQISQAWGAWGHSVSAEIQFAVCLRTCAVGPRSCPLTETPLQDNRGGDHRRPRSSRPPPSGR